MPDRRRLVLWLIAAVTALGTAVCFVLSDTPDKRYLNPVYVDVVVFGAGAFLLADAFRSTALPRFWSACLRGGIGAAIVTIHSFQFLFDLARRGAP
jgi:hypothetical protein